MIRCCKDCEQKHGGCHAACETYKQERKAYDEQMEAVRKQRLITQGLYAQKDRAIIQAMRRAKHAKKHKA